MHRSGSQMTWFGVWCESVVSKVVVEAVHILGHLCTAWPIGRFLLHLCGAAGNQIVHFSSWLYDHIIPGITTWIIYKLSPTLWAADVSYHMKSVILPEGVIDPLTAAPKVEDTDSFCSVYSYLLVLKGLYHSKSSPRIWSLESRTSNFRLYSLPSSFSFCTFSTDLLMRLSYIS